MMLYDLRCKKDHEFEGWFKDSVSFQDQHDSRLIECPFCGSTDVRKMLSVPNISKGQSEAKEAKPQVEMHRMMREFQKFIEKNCNYVGQDFVKEARKIHKNDKASEKGIYGEASLEEARQLDEEGVRLAILPWGRTDA